MRTIVHMSDLHFGRVDQAILGPLSEMVKKLGPQLVVVSGDLTQRAKSREFIQARQFLDGLPKPQIVVPGNHDVPLYNVVDRFLHPLDKYRRHISNEIETEYIDNEIAVLGINTARSLTFKDGRVSDDQIDAIHQKLCALGSHIIKIVVTHHPFDLPEHYDNDELVGKAPEAMESFARCGADLLLAGHLHISHANDTAARYKIGNYSAVVVQAGTATSTRGRGEANSFNVIRVQPAMISIDRFAWLPQTRTFELASTEVFERASNEWSRTDTRDYSIRDGFGG